MPAPTAADRGREVRRRLLAAAVELIPEIGWTAVSTRVLADRAGVAPGLVHYHFRSLQALLGEAAIGAVREVLAAGPALERSTAPEDGVAGLLGFLDAYSGGDPTSLLFTETYLAATRDESLRDQLSAVVVEFRDGLAGWLRAHGQDAPEATAAVLAAAIDGIVLHRALNPELDAATVTPVLRRLVTDTRRRKAGRA